MTDKKFELLLLQHGRNSDDIVNANKVVEEFINTSGSIIYGGTAIDFALRLKGSKLYPDSILPFADYDFLSPSNVQHSYELSMKLHQDDLPDITVITALHILTMRVVVAGHPIADISYMPENIYRKIPTISYKLNGGIVRIVHPMYQIIDMHIAIAYPYRNPPIEVFYQRISKDITRYNMLWDTYIEEFLTKIAKIPMNVANTRVKVPIVKHADDSPALYIGLVAYAQIRTKFKDVLNTPRMSVNIVNDSAENILLLDIGWVDGVPIPIDMILKLDDANSPKPTHRRVLDWLPASHKETIDGATISTYLSENTLYPAMKYDEYNMLFSCCQHTLAYFAIMATLATKNSELYQVWWSYYHDCIDMLNELSKEHHAESLFGNAVWPDLTVISIADGQKFWNRVNLANVADKRSGNDTTTQIFTERPRHFTPSFDNSMQLLDTLMDWDYSSPYFQVDGSKY